VGQRLIEREGFIRRTDSEARDIDGVPAVHQQNLRHPAAVDVAEPFGAHLSYRRISSAATPSCAKRVDLPMYQRWTCHLTSVGMTPPRHPGHWGEVAGPTLPTLGWAASTVRLPSANGHAPARRTRPLRQRLRRRTRALLMDRYGRERFSQHAEVLGEPSFLDGHRFFLGAFTGCGELLWSQEMCAGPRVHSVSHIP
jgi:hypothetical protein